MQFKDGTPVHKEAQFICGITKQRVWILNFFFAIAFLLAALSVVAAALYVHGDLKNPWGGWAERSCWFLLPLAWILWDAAFRARAQWKRVGVLAEMLSPNNWGKVRISTCCSCEAGCSKPSCFRTDFILSLDRDIAAALFLDGHPILHVRSLRLCKQEVARLKSRRL